LLSFLSFAHSSEDLSILSEDVASVVSPDDRNESPTSSSDWANGSNAAAVSHDFCQEFISKGPPKAEVQLRSVLVTSFPVFRGLSS
jgi:hypothetical protein